MQSNRWKIAVVVFIIVAAGALLADKSNKGNRSGNPSITAVPHDITVEVKDAEPKEEIEKGQKLPAVVDKAKTGTDTGVQGRQPARDDAAVAKTAAAQAKPVKPASDSRTKKKLPRLVDLGATKCIPCKMMAPVLEELKTEYKGQLIVEFIDVWENSSAGDKYGINSIPTQVFFDETGKEFFRHVGFFPKEDILATFKEHGLNLEKRK